jgi:hypothetical protein
MEGEFDWEREDGWEEFRVSDFAKVVVEKTRKGVYFPIDSIYCCYISVTISHISCAALDKSVRQARRTPILGISILTLFHFSLSLLS